MNILRVLFLRTIVFGLLLVNASVELASLMSVDHIIPEMLGFIGVILIKHFYPSITEWYWLLGARRVDSERPAAVVAVDAQSSRCSSRICDSVRGGLVWSSLLYSRLCAPFVSTKKISAVALLPKCPPRGGLGL